MAVFHESRAMTENQKTETRKPAAGRQLAYDRILVHVFITDNYLSWAELFLEALRFHHGERFRVRVDACDLSEAQISLLSRVYSNLEIHNRSIDWARIAKDMDVDQSTMDRWRTDVSRGQVNDTNVRVKLFISVSQRYRSMEAVLRTAKAEGYEMVLHSDADVYIRRPLEPLFRILAENDIALFMRPTKKRDTMKVWGGFIGFRLGEGTDRFLGNWMAHIDAVPPGERWRGFGQSVIWYATQETEGIRIGDLSILEEAPRFSKEFDPTATLWIGNSSLVGPTKVITLRRFWDDLKAGLPRLPLDRVTLADRLDALVTLAGLAWSVRRERLFARLHLVQRRNGGDGE